MNNDLLIFDETGSILKKVKDDTIQSVVIPDTVTKIEESAFSGCFSLQSVVIPESVTEIGKEAFAWCE